MQMAKSAYDAAGNMIAPIDHSMYRQGSEAYRGFQQTLAEMFDKQPLLLGAVGIAVGAGIAASLPASDLENRLMGDSADSLKDKAQELWDENRTRGVHGGQSAGGGKGARPDARGRRASIAGDDGESDWCCGRSQAKRNSQSERKRLDPLWRGA
jgi:hypothetical protein